jgi:hypothetical protein
MSRIYFVVAVGKRRHKPWHKPMMYRIAVPPLLRNASMAPFLANYPVLSSMAASQRIYEDPTGTSHLFPFNFVLCALIARSCVRTRDTSTQEKHNFVSAVPSRPRTYEERAQWFC